MASAPVQATFDSPYGIDHIILVGAGGTGSQMARNIARLLWDMQRRHLAIPQVTLCDPDRVSERNVGRQALFAPQDVGHNKARLLARRLNLALGLSIEAVDQAYTPRRSGHRSLIVGCVDNDAGRRAMAETRGLWLDCGNHSDSGQVILGSTADPAEVRREIARLSAGEGVVRCLPYASLLFPELLEPPAEEAPLPHLSCAEAVAAGQQALFVNDVMATAATSYLYKLLNRQPIRHFMSFASLDGIRPIAISAENLQAYLPD